jgi:hypothetical protein
MFGSLIEIEAETRKVFSTGFTDDIPFDFVIAFMSTTADTAIRFMRAREFDSERYRELTLDVLWDGLSVLGSKCQDDSNIEPLRRVPRKKEKP